MRGDIYQLRTPRNAVGHEQDGDRYCVVVQNEDMPLSTWVVCPTSRSAPLRSWRPEISVRGQITRVMTEQITAVDPQRLGEHVGILPFADMVAVDTALKIVLGLR